MSGRCQECGEWSSSLPHTCEPQWVVVLTRDEGDEVELEHSKARGADPEEAAEAFAQSWWEDDPPVDGDSLGVSVVVDGKPVRFEVTASWSLDVDARTVAPKVPS